MSTWNAAQYLKFKKERTQPALDLVMRIRHLSPQTIVDIGCGPGNSTSVLKSVFHNSNILGIDNSQNMIDKARKTYPDIQFEVHDVNSFEGRYDLLFSNACLQWIPNHHTLIPALMNNLNDGGTLAVQMPMNEEEPLYKIIKDIASDPKWGLDEVMRQTNGTLKPLEYYNILSGCASSFDIWEIKYHYRLQDHEALVEFVKGARLRPYLDFLGNEKGKEFEKEVIECSKVFYPVMSDGKVILGFRRFFFTANK